MLLALISACVSAPKPSDRLVLERTKFSALAGWDNDRFTEALPAFITSCRKMATLPKNKLLIASGIAGKMGDWKEVCNAAMQMQGKNDAEIKAFFEQWFSPLLVRNNDKAEGLFTGYYEIALQGNFSKTSRYTEPLYMLSDDVCYMRPLYSRQQINDGALAREKLELLYVDDPVKAFFLHIQGSGRVLLEDGRTIRVGYAAQNGHPYVAIGRTLIDQGELEKKNMSARAIKEWLYTHPEKAKALMEVNPSYVFFKEIKGAGPIGGEGVPLTPERSLAVDKHFIPYGVPLWLETDYPETPISKPAPLRKLFISQDTGGAIKGPVRGDVFFGYGEKPEALAEYMKGTGRYVMLLPIALAEKALAIKGKKSS